jgi:hypothetical protein
MGIGNCDGILILLMCAFVSHARTSLMNLNPDEKRTEFMGQCRVTPSEKAKIAEMLQFYKLRRKAMARQVMETLFYHYCRGDHLLFPLRFVVDDKKGRG